MRTHYTVIPAVNCWEHTRKCIESIKCSEQHKVILVDNGSTDATKHQAVKLKNVIYVRNEENKGVSHAWNQGIKKALEDKQCGYIYIVNNDNIFRHDSLDNLITYADNIKLGKTNYQLISSMPYVGDEEHFETAPVVFTESEGGCYSAFMIARETIDNIGWFDEGFYPAYFEDNDYDRRIKLLEFFSTKTIGSQFIAGRSKTIAENPHVADLVRKGYARRYYLEKWGGAPGHETFDCPFNKVGNELICTKQGNPQCAQRTELYNHS